MRVIFMGTPDFAVPALEKLIASNHEVIAIYTKAPKPAGRGYAEIKSKPHQIGEQYGIPVYTPKNFKDPKDIEDFLALEADIAVVAAYGLLLPKSILQAPKFECINIHPSSLPRWRGAAPLHHTILAGDKETDICIMHMDEGLDTGDVYFRQKLQLGADMTTKELHDLTSKMGGDLVLVVLGMIQDAIAVRVKQTEEGITYAHKLTRAHERIDWTRRAYEIHCQIRAFSPRPGAYFKYGNETIKILAAEYEEGEVNSQPGLVLDESLSIACGSGVIKPTLLQREGRQIMEKDALLRGLKIAPGTVLL